MCGDADVSKPTALPAAQCGTCGDRPAAVLEDGNLACVFNVLFIVVSESTLTLTVEQNIMPCYTDSSLIPLHGHRVSRWHRPVPSAVV